MKRFAVLLLTLALAVCCTLPAFAAGTIEVNEDISVSADYDWTRFKGQNITLNVYNWGEYISNGSDDSVDVVAAFEQFTDLVNEGKQIVNDNDARYAAFAKAEALFLEEDLTCPTVYDVSWCLTHANEYSKINAMYGPCNYKAVNWETSEEAYTTEQYEEFAAAFDAATKA